MGIYLYDLTKKPTPELLFSSCDQDKLQPSCPPSSQSQCNCRMGLLWAEQAQAHNPQGIKEHLWGLDLYERCGTERLQQHQFRT